MYNILAHDQARYRILSSLPSGEVATLLKNLLPLLSSQERDTLVPATRSLTLMLDEDDGRRRALGALKDIALRHMVLGLSGLLRSSDPEVAYAALEAALKLLLDEEPAKRVLLVLAERVRSAEVHPTPSPVTAPSRQNSSRCPALALGSPARAASRLRCAPARPARAPPPAPSLRHSLLHSFWLFFRSSGPSLWLWSRCWARRTRRRRAR